MSMNETAPAPERRALLRSTVSACLLASITALGACEGPPENGETTAIRQAALAPGDFSGWTQVPNGTFNEAPAVSSSGVGSLLVVGRGTDNNYWTTVWNAGLGWSGFSPVPGGGRFSSRPATTQMGGFGTAKVASAFAGKGLDNAIWANVCSGTGHCTLSGWAPVSGGPFQSAPALAFQAPFLYLFARKADNIVYFNRNDLSTGYAVTGWQGWQVIPNGLLSSAPAAVSNSGSLYVAARGTDNFPYLTKFNGSTWGPWLKAPFVSILGDPALSQWAGDHLDLFGLANDNTMFVMSYDAGTWSGRQRLNGGTFQAGPGAWSWGVGHVDVLGLGLDNAFWKNTYQE